MHLSVWWKLILKILAILKIGSFFCVESEFSVIFLISGVSRDFQHLLFAYCSLKKGVVYWHRWELEDKKFNGFRL